MTKEFDPEDPMELVGVEVVGDSDVVMEQIIQEYLSMGWSSSAIFFLFRTPNYMATHRIYKEKGDSYVKKRIKQMAEQWAKGWIRGDRVDAG
ncbi:MAG: hypothetical protein IIC81_09125 [Chloroflexi bacterium]|nr:hypothetical protein [Chloroflexota bacterium]